MQPAVARKEQWSRRDSNPGRRALLQPHSRL